MSRVLATAILLILAAAACWGDALGAGYPINPFGMLFLFFAVVAWFKWQPIRDGFITAKGESDLPVIRLAAKIIEGMETLRHGPARRRRSPSN